MFRFYDEQYEVVMTMKWNDTMKAKRSEKSHQNEQIHVSLKI